MREELPDLSERFQSDVAGLVDEFLALRSHIDQISHVRLILMLREVQPVQRGRNDVIGDRGTLRDLAERRWLQQVDRGKIECIARRVCRGAIDELLRRDLRGPLRSDGPLAERQLVGRIVDVGRSVKEVDLTDVAQDELEVLARPLPCVAQRLRDRVRIGGELLEDGA